MKIWHKSRIKVHITEKQFKGLNFFCYYCCELICSMKLDLNLGWSVILRDSMPVNSAFFFPVNCVDIVERNYKVYMEFKNYL